MSVMEQIASALGRRDEVPNQRLAERIAANDDVSGVRELVQALASGAAPVRADCVKVLYEIGYRKPALVAPYVDDMLKLLTSRNNRLVWGGMITLASIAALVPRQLYARRAIIQSAIKTGSVITVDNGIKTLALVAAARPAYRRVLFPYLLDHLRTCRAKDLPQHAEHVAVAVTAGNRAAFVQVIAMRLPSQPASRVARLKRVVRGLSE